jgi:hypothetical protein
MKHWMPGLPGRFLLPAILVLAACGGEPSPEKLLEKSAEIPELYAFGSRYLPLWRAAMADSDATDLIANARELARVKQLIARLEVPERIRLHRSDWETNQRLFSRAVDYLLVVLGKCREGVHDPEAFHQAVQAVYDWWYLLVDLL